MKKLFKVSILASMLGLIFYVSRGETGVISTLTGLPTPPIQEAASLFLFGFGLISLTYKGKQIDPHL